MKIILSISGIILCLSVFSYSATAQQTTEVACPNPNTTTTCPQVNWATPYIRNEAETLTITTLQPNTRYYLIVEALPTVAPCSRIVVVTNMDGATDWNGTPFNGNFGGVDFPGTVFLNRPYKAKIGFKTPTLASGEFVSQVYMKYRMECSVATGTGTVAGGTRVPSTQKQILLP